MPGLYRTLAAFLILPLLNAAACTSPKRSVQEPRQPGPAVAGKQSTLTLVLKSEWNPDSSVHFSIYNDIRNEGLRPHRHVVRKNSSSFLLCFTGSTGDRADSVYIDHPLKERVETNIGQGKTINELFIREEAYTEVSVPYTPEIKKLLCIDLETQKQQTLNIR